MRGLTAAHSFKHTTGARYDQAAAELAWARTIEFFGAQPDA